MIHWFQGLTYRYRDLEDDQLSPDGCLEASVRPQDPHRYYHSLLDQLDTQACYHFYVFGPLVLKPSDVHVEETLALQLIDPGP